MNLLRELEHFIISINKFLATTLLKGIAIKRQCYKKPCSDIYRNSNYASFYLTLPILVNFSIVHSDNGLYLSVEKITKSSK